MREYVVTSRQAILPAGKVRLTLEQARPRAHALRGTKKEGVYEIVDAINFKRGETFAWDQRLPKEFADDLTAAADEKAAEKIAKEHVVQIRRLDEGVKSAREALAAEEAADKREALMVALERALSARLAAD